jgi:hypothetical protein
VRLAGLWIAWTFLLASPALADDPAWVGPIRDDRTGAVDPEMDAAWHKAVLLLGPPGRKWRAGPPVPGACPTCAVVTIQGHREPEPRYEVAVRRHQEPMSRSVVWTAGSDVAPFDLAQALALHCLLLLGEPLIALPQAPQRTEPRHQFSLGLGPALTRSTSGTFRTGGSEVVAWGELGSLHLGAALGFEAFGAGRNSLGRYQYRAVPLTLLAGTHWQHGSVVLGLAGGLRIAAYSFDFQTSVLDETQDTGVSAVVEARLAWRIRPMLSVAVALRPSFTFDAVSIGHEDVFEMPHLFWQGAVTLLVHL